MKHIIKLEVELAELSDEDRIELQKLGMSDCDDPDDEDEGLPRASDIEAYDLAHLIADYIGASNDEIWAGSEMYAQIVSVRPVSA